MWPQTQGQLCAKFDTSDRLEIESCSAGTSLIYALENGRNGAVIAQRDVTDAGTDRHRRKRPEYGCSTAESTCYLTK